MRLKGTAAASVKERFAGFLAANLSSRTVYSA